MVAVLRRTDEVLQTETSDSTTAPVTPVRLRVPSLPLVAGLRVSDGP
jgi:hypothetical protein